MYGSLPLLTINVTTSTLYMALPTDSLMHDTIPQSYGVIDVPFTLPTMFTTTAISLNVFKALHHLAPFIILKIL